jgi:hypothetical protein
MPSRGPGDSEPSLSRHRRVGEPEVEHEFWCRYWEVLRSKGVALGKEVWYERSCLRSIRELKPRRLREAEATDVTRFLESDRGGLGRLGQAVPELLQCARDRATGSGTLYERTRKCTLATPRFAGRSVAVASTRTGVPLGMTVVVVYNHSSAITLSPAAPWSRTSLLLACRISTCTLITRLSSLAGCG